MAAEPRVNARIVEHTAISALKAYPGHARRHSKTQIKKLGRSIAEFGIVLPVLIDEMNVIIAGHGIVEAASSLGHDGVPTLRVGHLSEAQKQALRLALNRMTEDGIWDRSRLSLEMA